MLQESHAKTVKDLRTLSDFIAIYCRENHRVESRTVFQVGDSELSHALGDKKILLCRNCARLLQHGIAKRLACPQDPKPACKKCKTPCYAPGYREEIRKVMRFSGLYLIKHGRLDLLVHYLF